MQHTLSSGQWVDMRPVQDLKVRDREVYEAPLMDFEVGVDADGKPDLGGRKFSMKVPRVQRRALLCRLLKSWSFINDDGVPLPLPRWEGGIENEESFGELPLSDWDEIEALLQPYIAKISVRPDPKGSRSATTSSSSTSSTTKARANSRPD